MKTLLFVLLCAMFIGCSIPNREEAQQKQEQELGLSKRIEVISGVTHFGWTDCFYVVKDNVTGNEYIVGRATEAISIVPIIPSK